MAPRRPSASRRLATAAVWPLGVALTSWHYMWRITPLHRRELPGTIEHDGPPPLPAGVPLDDAQLSDAGVGPLYHRRYCARIAKARSSAEELMDRVLADPNELAPTEFARFTKVYGGKGRMQQGDEYVVRMPGPWDGPVRAVEVQPASFTLVTLAGHLEAGRISFSARDLEDGRLELRIEAWARGGDPLSNVLFDRLRVNKEVQLHMWTSFLERAARLAQGRLVGGIDIDTRRLGETAPPQSPIRDPAAERALDELHDTGLNFDLGDRAQFAHANGWKIDEYAQALPPEGPGPPEPDGSWEAARRLMREYQFADPSIVRAVYRPDRPLDERDMVLVASFHGLRFRLGVRVGGVTDETRTIEGRQARVWGWNYRTLRGHLEMGQMDYEVWKWLDTGEVEFRICAFSRPAQIANPVVRLGFRLVGRRKQLDFYRQVYRRMRRLTVAELETRRTAAYGSAVRRRA